MAAPSNLANNDVKGVAIAHVDRFHQLYNDEKFDELYEMCGGEIRIKQGKDRFIQLLQAFRSVTGKVISYREKKVPKITTESKHTSISFLFETKFEKVTWDEGFKLLVLGQEATIDYYDQGT